MKFVGSKLLLTAASVLLASSTARALVFQEFVDSNGSHVLVARDCKNFSKRMEPWKSFDEQHGCRGGAKNEGVTAPSDDYIGDGAVLDYILSLSEGKGNFLTNLQAMSGGVASDAGTAQTVAAQQRSPHAFSEVWLNSGGGDVDAGVDMARVIRRHGMTVKVPAKYQCISACTITFMGGVIRLMDDGAAFRVHSASGVEGGINERLAAKLKADPDGALRDNARRQQVNARYMAARLMTLFQNTLLVPIRAPQQPESDRSFCEWAGGTWTIEGKDSFCSVPEMARADTHFSYLDTNNAQRLTDAARIRREGQAAYQDILMRIERDAMALAIGDLEATLPQRGQRAKPALNMIRAMFMTSITDTTYMTPNQMVTMGYLTPIFDAAQK